MPLIAIFVVAGSLVGVWLDGRGRVQAAGAMVIACCAVLTVASRNARRLATLAPAIGGAVAVALTSREYFAFWGAGSALLVTAAFAEVEARQRRVPVIAVAAAFAGVTAAIVAPGADGLPPLFPVGVATVAVVLIESLVGWARLARDLRVKAADYLQRAQVSEASAAALELRTGLAQELHDSLSHHIASIAVQAEAGQVALANEALATIADLSREALRELEIVLFDLRTPLRGAGEGMDFDLSCIDTLLAKPLRLRGIIVDVEIATAQTNTMVVAAIYRIVQESLTNALRHSAASKVTVAIVDDRADVHIQVCDDGVGINWDTPPSGMGISGIQTRAAQLGGQADFSTAVPRGTLVSVRIPKAHG